MRIKKIGVLIVSLIVIMIIGITTVAIAFDGRLTFMHGSHNRKEDFTDNVEIDENEAIHIAFNYLSEKKKELEAEETDSEEDEELEYIVATEEMVLPDGVKPGDTFALEKLPKYRMYLDTEQDMNEIKTKKLMYGEKMAWLVEFTVRTSWGDYDSVFIPLIHIYVDVANGEVLGMNSTDGVI